mgnify:FL=1
MSPTWQIRLLVYVTALTWCAGEKRFGKYTALRVPRRHAGLVRKPSHHEQSPFVPTIGAGFTLVGLMILYGRIEW